MHSASRPDTAATKIYSMAELNETRRLVITRARTVAPGDPERNQRRQIARSIRRLFDDPMWLAKHTIGALGKASWICNRCAMKMQHLADLRSFGAHPAVRIYRCYHCNNVISELR
jgi:hypothetical protein